MPSHYHKCSLTFLLVYTLQSLDALYRHGIISDHLICVLFYAICILNIVFYCCMLNLTPLNPHPDFTTFNNMPQYNIMLALISQHAKVARLQISCTGGKHYENTLLQYTFFGCKNENFHWKNFDIFFIFAQNIDFGYMLEPPRRGGSNEYPQSMFWSKNKKNRYTPAYPSFTI